MIVWAAWQILDLLPIESSMRGGGRSPSRISAVCLCLEPERVATWDRPPPGVGTGVRSGICRASDDQACGVTRLMLVQHANELILGKPAPPIMRLDLTS